MRILIFLVALQAIWSRTITIEVGPVKMDCMGIIPMKCLQVKFPDQTAFLNFYGEIENFNWIECYKYILSVREEKVEHPMADGSSLRYILLEVLESRLDPKCGLPSI